MEPFSAPQQQPPFDEAAFARAVAEMRPALQGYVRSLLLHTDATDDVVQDTCLFLWERRDQFELEHLRATAFRTAWFKALSVRRDRQREKLVHFSDDALQRIAGAAEELAGEADPRLQALRGCLAKLPPNDLHLLRLKYIDQNSLAKHARQQNVAPNRLQKAISRLRLALRRCIEISLPPHS